jgi:anti-sigma B factor antagonist
VTRFAFDADEHGAVAVVRLRGELDLHATGDFELELVELADAPGIEVLALDLRELVFMDSGGLRVIIVVGRRLAEAGRRLVLVRGPHPVMRVFELTGMMERLEFVDAPEHVHS